MTQERTITLSTEDLHAAVMDWLSEQGIDLEPGDKVTTNQDGSAIGVVITILSPAPIPAEASCA
jgi:hypothetical protein